MLEYGVTKEVLVRFSGVGDPTSDQTATELAGSSLCTCVAELKTV